MKTIEAFKLEHNISTINLLQGNGRMFATIGDKSLIVGTNTDLKKPLFVTWNDKGFYCVVNSAAKVVASI